MSEQSMTYKEVEGEYPIAIRIFDGAGIRDHPDFFRMHWHDGLQICYIQEGRIRFYIDGKIIDGKAGDLITVTPDSVHYIEVENKADPDKIHVFFAFFYPEFLERYFPDYDAYYFTNENCSAPDYVEELISKLMMNQDALQQKESDSVLDGYLIHLLTDACQTGIRKKEEMSSGNGIWRSETIKRILSYLEAHYGEKLRESEVAERFYISPKYFPKFFKQNMGMTFTEYLKKLRLNKASQMLLTTSDSVLSISLQCGFGEAGRFTAAFKEMYGMTPLQYRKSRG